MEELGKLDSNDLVSAYIEMQGQQPQANDLTDQKLLTSETWSGGEQQYNNSLIGQLSPCSMNTLKHTILIVETGDVSYDSACIGGLSPVRETEWI